MTQKAKNTDPKTVEVPVFTEFTIAVDPKKDPVRVPVVASIDDLPRSARRLLRNVSKDSHLSVQLANAPQYQMLVNYALAYASTQGVSINLDAIEDDDVYDRAREEALIAGGRLMSHFAKAAGDDEGKAEGASEPAA